MKIKVNFMSISKQPFNIPAINNQKIALMIHLGMDHDDAEQWSQVKELDKALVGTTRVSVFEYESSTYHVVHSSCKEFIADRVLEFNSSLWAISMVASNSHTHKTIENITSEQILKEFVYWLQDNVEMGSQIFFHEDHENNHKIDSTFVLNEIESSEDKSTEEIAKILKEHVYSWLENNIDMESELYFSELSDGNYITSEMVMDSISENVKSSALSAY